ncbi:MAG TPA: ABC transporter permease [Vicinamibacterales bacterium]|nr:ABC transporter permease [Vicinamibacterales bacterium]
MGTLLHDLRYAVRALARSPVFAIVAIATMALGIGANAAMFSVVSGVLLSPLPYADSGRLVRVWARDLKQSQPGSDQSQVSPGDFIDWQARSQTLPAMAAFTTGDVAVSGGGDPEQIAAAGVTVNFFDVLGVRPFLGRGFLPDDTRSSAALVVLGHALWWRRYGADPAVLGRTIVLNGLPVTVIGVMGPGFSFPGATALWRPSTFPSTRQAAFLNVVARLRAGSTLAAARTEMETIASGLQKQYPNSNNSVGVNVIRLLDQEVGPVRPALLLLFAMVGLVLLIACVNLANLLVVRATTRLRELALRAALGASRWRIARQLLTESLLIGVLGGAAGLFAARLVLPTLLALNADGLPRVTNITIDGRVLLFTIALSILTGLFFGVAPAVHVGRINLEAVLREGGRSGPSAGSGGRTRRALIVCQLALALVVLAASGLLLKSFARVLGVDPGFRAANVLTFALHPSSPRYSVEQVRSFYPALIERLEGLPGVSSAAATFMLPLGGDNRIYGFRLANAPAEAYHANFRVVTPNYFATMGMSIVGGRGFSRSDTEESAPVLIVNQRMAERFWGSASSATGQRVIVRGSLPAREIVGVVSDVRHFGLESDAEPEMYVPHAQVPAGPMTVLVRTRVDPLSLVGAIKGEVSALDQDLPVSAVRTLDDITARARAPRRFTLLLLTGFAGAALLLAAVGVYGVTAQAVTHRTREIGLRVALGASPADVLALIMGGQIRLLAAGIALGTGGALVTGRLITSMLFQVRPNDPTILVAVVAFLALIAAAASYMPARRALGVDPVIALGAD